MRPRAVRSSAESRRGSAVAASVPSSMNSTSRPGLVRRPLRRDAAAVATRSRSSAPITLSSSGSVGAMRRAASAPGSGSGADTCGSRSKPRHSAREASGITAARCTSSGECSAPICAAIARQTARVSARSPTIETCPPCSRSRIAGMPCATPARRTTRSAEPFITGSNGCTGFCSGGRFTSTARRSPVPTRTCRKSASPGRRSQRRAGFAPISIRVAGSGFSAIDASRCRSAVSRTVPRSSSR